MAARILITGASGGIGAALARQLANDGHALLLHGRNELALHALRSELPGTDVQCCAAELASSEGIKQLIGAALTFNVDTIIHNAGISDFHLLEDAKANTTRDTLQINLLAPILLTQGLLPHLRRKKSAQLVFVGSILGSIGHAGYSIYCASKFGLRGFAESLRREVADSPIHIVYAAPRSTHTGINSAAVTAMNAAMGSGTDQPGHVAGLIIEAMQHKRNTRYIGWPEQWFVRLNSIIPSLVDKAMQKKLPLIKQFARS